MSDRTKHWGCAPQGNFTYPQHVNISTPKALEYEAMISRKVNTCGQLRWEGGCYFLSASLAGWNVGLQRTSEGINVWFGRLLLGSDRSLQRKFFAGGYPPAKSSGNQ